MRRLIVIILLGFAAFSCDGGETSPSENGSDPDTDAPTEDGDLDRDEETVDGDRRDADEEQDSLELDEDTTDRDEETLDAPVCQQCAVRTFSHRISGDEVLLGKGEYLVTSGAIPGLDYTYEAFTLSDYALAYCDASFQLFICYWHDGSCYHVDIPDCSKACGKPVVSGSTFVGNVKLHGSDNNDFLRLDLDTMEYEVIPGDFARHHILTHLDFNGTHIVWKDGSSGGFKVMNLDDLDPYTIEGSFARRTSYAAMDNDKVAFISDRFNDDGRYVFLHTIGSNESVILTPELNNWEKSLVAISTPWVVWVEDWLNSGNPNGSAFLVAQNFETDERRIIDPSEYGKDVPDIDGSKVVWTDLRNGGISPQWTYQNADIYLYDIGQEVVQQITKDSKNQYSSLISGRWIIYVDYRWRADYRDLTVFDLCTLDLYQDEPWCAPDTNPAWIVETDSSQGAVVDW